MSQFFYTDNGKKEEIKLERWIWGVVYDDNRELKQFSDDGTFHRIREIDQDRAKIFVALKPDLSQRIDIILPPGARIIHKYRHHFYFDPRTLQKVSTTIYVFGYKYGGHHFYTFILPDDRIIQSVDEEPKLFIP